MTKQEIQEQVYQWACGHGFTAPYGVLTGEHTNAKGRKYRGVTFGYARTHDFEVCIYGERFIVLRNSSLPRDPTVFKTVEDLMTHLNTL